LKLVKGFDLLSKWKIPRLCSKTGGIMDPTDYFVATSPLKYSVSKESSYGSLVSQMNNGQYWMMTNGTNADGVIGTWDKYTDGGSFSINTANALHAGKYSTVLRGCTLQEDIIEIGLDLEIHPNEGPKFASKLETYFEVTVGEEYTYNLPKINDNEGHSIEVYIENSTDTKYEFPPYIFFSNLTN
jgi:hypothetical protein